jgi:hypothetical protein
VPPQRAALHGPLPDLVKPLRPPLIARLERRSPDQPFGPSPNGQKSSSGDE